VDYWATGLPLAKSGNHVNKTSAFVIVV